LLPAARGLLARVARLIELDELVLPDRDLGTDCLPSSTASAMPAAYSWMARMASSLPGIT